MKRHMDDALFLSLKQIIHKNGRIELPAQGSSMFPFIRNGNLCSFRPVGESRVSVGDILLFRSASSRLVAHRLHSVVYRDGESLYICKGDANLGYDEPIRAEQMLGVLHSIRKGNKHILMSDPLTAFWTKAIVALPALSSGLNRYMSGKTADPIGGRSE
ncbi:hypothetical protein KP806_16925 [Paenibacillus sp. N4]|uniref:hypothetical protein n=1 Tax=Paenibacillus vietnamensis TaxID=2590547 RepID=UPI001CD0F44D|nr:hypothetical protein [Paenibacillus vietnamensis]MCA0756742.1 hypothetical protein [Paenibacillus vietnamensis]